MRAGGRTQTRLVRSGTSYISQDDMAQHFGLGGAARAESLEVRWPDASLTTQTFRVVAGYRYHVAQGEAPRVVE